MQVIIVSASFSTLLDSWFVRDKSHLGHRQKVHFGRAIPLWDSIGNGFFTLPRGGLWLFYNHYFPNFEYIFRRFEESERKGIRERNAKNWHTEKTNDGDRRGNLQIYDGATRPKVHTQNQLTHWPKASLHRIFSPPFLGPTHVLRCYEVKMDC